MAFKDILLPEWIAFGAQGGPDWAPSAIESTESGDEAREVVKTKALGKWTIAYQSRLREHWETFQDIFYVMGSVRDSLRYHDVLDDSCSSAQAYLRLIDSTHWQMVKRRTVRAFGSATTYTYDQDIILPVDTTVSGTGSYSVSAMTGIITKASGAAPTGFLCERFHKLVRFDFDHLLQTMTDRSMEDSDEKDFFVDYAGLTIIEIPLTSA